MGSEVSKPVGVRAVRPVTRLNGPVLPRRCACASHEPGEEECEECAAAKGSLLQRMPTGPTPGRAPRVVHDVFRAPGTALPPETAADSSGRLGRDFADVRVHADAK